MKRLLPALLAIAVGAGLLPRPVSGYDWAGYGKGAGGSETIESSDYTPTGVRWLVHLPSQVFASPAIVNGKVYAAARGNLATGAGGVLYCLDAQTGATVWSWTAPDGSRFDSSPTLMHGRVYACLSSGEVLCFRAETGELAWSRVYDLGTDPEYMASPLLTNGMLVLGGGASRFILALNEQTGDELWRFDTGQSVYSSPREYRGRIYVGNSDGIYTCLDLSGNLVWQYSTGGLVGLSSVETRFGRAYLFPGGFNFDLHCLKAEDGSLLWKGNPAAPPVPGTGGPQLSEQFLQEVLCQDPAGRQAYIEAWAGVYQFDPEDLRAYQDVAAYDPTPSLVPDDFPPQPPFVQGTHLKPSSPAVGGDCLVYVQKDIGVATPRFSVVCMRAAGASDPQTGAPRWWYQEVMGTEKVGHCPTPALALDRVVAPIGRKLYVFDLSSGAILYTLALEADAYASPAVGNGMVVVGCLNGALYALDTTNHAPSVPSAPFVPADGGVIETPEPVLGWSASTDPDGAHGQGTLRYLIEIDDDTDLDFSADLYATTPGQTSLTLPTQPDGSYLWRVRCVDPDGALSAWSPVQHFTLNATGSGQPPPDVKALIPVPGSGQVALSWTNPAPGTFDGILVTVTDEFGHGLPPIQLGVTQSTLVGGLTDFVRYTFLVQTTRSSDGAKSPGVSASATPIPLISRNGVAYGSIKDALKDAQDGDVILLGAGTIIENVVIKKQKVDLKGVGPGITILQAQHSNKPVIEVDKEGVSTISMMTVTGGTDGIYVNKEGEAHLRNLILMGLENGLHMKGDSTAEMINVTDSDNSQHGVWMEPHPGSDPGTFVLTGRNNLITFNAGVGFKGPPGSGIQFAFTYSDFHANQGGDFSGTAGPGSGDLFLDPVYVGKSPSDYRLKLESPCLDAGDPVDPVGDEPAPNGGRIDMGAYGGTMFTTLGSDGETEGGPPALPPGCFLSASARR